MTQPDQFPNDPKRSDTCALSPAGTASGDDGPMPVAARILVVEDEILAGIGIATMLENTGFEPLGPFSDVSTALRLLDEEGCALAILDVHLASGETSAPLAERLRHAGIPFLVMSGDVSRDDVDAFDGAPSLPKPVGARSLVAAVHNALS